MIIIVTKCSINSQIGDCEKRILPASVRNVTVDRIGNGMCEDQGRYRERNQSSHACHKTTCVSPKFSITPQWCHVEDVEGEKKKAGKHPDKLRKVVEKLGKRSKTIPQYSVALIVLSRPICCVSVRPRTGVAQDLVSMAQHYLFSLRQEKQTIMKKNSRVRASLGGSNSSGKCDGGGGSVQESLYLKILFKQLLLPEEMRKENEQSGRRSSRRKEGSSRPT